jgi:hypothetical protein
MIPLIIRQWASGATVDKESLVKALQEVLDDFANATCPFCGRKFYRDPRALLENPFCSKCIDERTEPRPPGKWVDVPDRPGYMVFQADKEKPHA